MKNKNNNTKKDFILGCHQSFTDGFYQMGLDALSIEANTIQFFLRNPRGSKAKDIDPKDLDSFLQLVEDYNFGPLLVHAPYTLNPASQKEYVREFAEEVFRDDLERMDLFPGNFYNFHPGNHVGQGVEKGIDLIADLLNRILKKEYRTTLLLETMAGKGTEIGRNFEELARILEKVERSDKMGVCLDTCHIFDGGYSLEEDLDQVLEEFDHIVGLDRLYAIHLNDSKNERGSRKDRHATIGNGYIGLEGITNIINHPKIAHIPFYLETPTDLAGHGEEIQLLRSLRQ